MTRYFSVQLFLPVVLACVHFSAAHAQYPGQSGQPYGMPALPNTVNQDPPILPPHLAPIQAPQPKWDYRFDAQFQSTIKPYLRWYMRYDPRQPGNRVLPRDFGFGLNYGYAYPVHTAHGYGNSFGTCGGDCGIDSYDPNVGSDGRNRPSLYWNHLRYLRDVYGQTPIVRADGTRSNGSRGGYLRKPFFEGAPDAPSGGGAYDTDPSPVPPDGVIPMNTSRKPIWVARNEASGSYSVLYQEPPSRLAQMFTKGIATVTPSAKILKVEWADTPSWESKVAVINGRLTEKSQG